MRYSQRAGRVRIGKAVFRFEASSVAAPGKDHDRYLAADGFLAVADGLTPTGHTTASQLTEYVERILGRLARNVASGTPGQEALRRTIADFAPDHQGTLDATPSCAIAFMTSSELAVNTFALGDCLVALRTHDGREILTADERLAAFDNRVVDAIAADMARGAGFEEALRAQSLALRSNRLMANREGSYWIVNNDPSAANELAMNRTLIDEVETILICSDGFARLVEIFNSPPHYADLVAQATQDGLDSLMRRLRTQESPENSLATHPRLGRFDDATAILATRIG